MKYFTIKDFILYNGPCINCGNKIVVNAHQIKKENLSYHKLSAHMEGNTFHIQCLSKQFKNPTIQIDIPRNIYNLRFQVNYTDKSIIKKNFESFLNDYSLCIITMCKRCLTSITSDDLVFDTNLQIVRPITIKYEKISLGTDDALYIIESNIQSGKSKLRIFDSRGRKALENIDIPLLTLGRLKDKEYAISKIKKYLIFS